MYKISFYYIILLHYTTSLSITMFGSYVTLQTSLLCSLIITMTAWVFDTLMYRLNMLLKRASICKLSFTLITWMLDTFML